MEQFNSSSDILVEKLYSLADGVTNVSMVEEFHRITLDLIGKVCFVRKQCLVPLVAQNNSPRSKNYKGGLQQSISF